MPKETKENLQQQTGMGNILTSVYKYLKDNNIMLGTWKNPIVSVKKARVPVFYYDKRNIIGATNLNTSVPFFSYKNNNTSKTVRLLTFNTSVKANKAVEWDIYKNATLTGVSWEAFASAQNIQKDISATAYSGGVLVGGIDIMSVDRIYLPLGDDPVIFECLPGETLTFTVKADANTADIYLRLRIEEIDL